MKKFYEYYNVKEKFRDILIYSICILFILCQKTTKFKNWFISTDFETSVTMLHQLNVLKAMK